MKKRLFMALTLLVMLQCCLYAACTQAQEGFIRVSGKKLVDENGIEFISRGIELTNGYSFWQTPLDSARLHHDESSYAEIAELGFNTVRFVLDARYFRSESGWAWMDENIDWARKYGIRLIPGLAIFPPSPQEAGKAIWEDASVRQGYIDFWQEYARRYSDEPVIMGFDLLNEPSVYVAGGDYDTAQQMWKALANDMIDAIRQVDKNHIIFLEGVFTVVDTLQNPMTSRWHESVPDEEHLFLVEDKNTVYSIHNYYPSSFAMQDMDWYGSGGQFATYPSGLVWIIPEGVQTPVSLPEGNTAEWMTLETTYTAPQTPPITGHVILNADAVGTDAKVWFDDVVLTEYDENGAYVRTVMTEDFSQNTYNLCTADGAGVLAYETSGGVGDSRCASLAGTTARSFVVMDQYKLTPGYRYVLSASMRGENVSAGAFAAPRLDLYRQATDEDADGDREQIRQYLSKSIQFRNSNNVPVWMGEFGTSKASFRNDRGGDRWLEDVLEICDEEGLYYCCYTYRDGWFGLWESTSLGQKGKLNTLMRDALLYGNDINTDHVTVTFNSGGGKGEMKSQTFRRDTNQTLNPQAFTRKGYRFTGWNTKEDGSGDHYDNRAQVKLFRNLVLFAQWKKLPANTAVLPQEVTVVDSGAFENTSFEAVILGENVHTIDDRAFAGCTQLKEIVIPASVTSIMGNAFEGCNEELLMICEAGSAAMAYAQEQGYSFETSL